MEDKELIKERILKRIDEFYKECKLPPNNVTDDDWNKYINIIEKHLISHDIIEQLEHVLNILSISALSSSKAEKEFNVNNLIKAIDDLCAFKIYSEERDIIKYEIKEAINFSYDDKTLLKLLHDTITEECWEEKTKEPEIDDNDWLTAFDIIKAHYQANNIMKQYLNDLKCYIESVVFWANEQNTDDKELLSGYAIDSLYHIIDANELGSIAEEIDEKLKGKTYKK